MITSKTALAAAFGIFAAIASVEAGEVKYNFTSEFEAERNRNSVSADGRTGEPRERLAPPASSGGIVARWGWEESDDEVEGCPTCEGPVVWSYSRTAQSRTAQSRSTRYRSNRDAYTWRGRTRSRVRPQSVR